MLVLLSIALLLLDSRGYLEKNLRYWLQGVVSPMQYTVNFPSMLFRNLLTAVTTQDSLLKENKMLKTQLISLKLDHQRFLNLQNENRQLRLLLHSSEAMHIKVAMAEVLFVAAGAGAGANEWILNKGSQDGVFVGQPVLDARGVVGQAVMRGPKTSRVMLISDSRSSIPVESLQTGLRTMVQGEGASELLSLVFIPKTEKVLSGDLLVSSGVDGQFPKGYPVGKVLKVADHAGDQFLSISVLPIAELDHERFVLLLGPERDENV